MAPPQNSDPLERPGYRVLDTVERLLMVTLWFIVATVPTWLGLLFLIPDLRNVALFALAGWFLGPALSAGIYAMHRAEPGADAPTRQFWRGYRLNLRQVSVLWTGVVLVVAVLVVDLVATGTPGSPIGTGWRVPLWVLLAGVAVWSMHLLVILSNYNFRNRDALRLAGFYLLTKPLVSLSLLTLAVGLAVVGARAATALPVLGGVLSWAIDRLSAPAQRALRSRFVAAPPQATQSGDG